MLDGIYCPPIGFRNSGGPFPERADEDRFWMDATLTRLFNRFSPNHAKVPPRARDVVARVLALEAEMKLLNDARLREAADAVRVQMVAHGFTCEQVARAFALAREASRRHLGKPHYPVQILAGASMLAGRMIEMNTGEGKTVTALLPAAAAALAGLPVHVITVNDNLAKRDAEDLKPAYEALGLTVGLIQHDDLPPARRLAYGRDIVYCTNKELTFDYLRDRIALGQVRSRTRVQLGALLGEGDLGRKLLLRGLFFGIVDEADSVMIDEARVPLLISSDAGPEDGEAQAYQIALSIAREMVETRDFTIAWNERAIEFTPLGLRTIERTMADFGRPWRTAAARRELMQQALTALYLFDKDKHYIVADEKVQIVDEYTGRVMADRFWERGLQQLIEAKEGCAPSGKRETLARMTYQRFFARYLRLAGMSGTLREIAPELRTVYGLKIAKIPTNRPIKRFSMGTSIYATADRKWQAVRDRIAAMTETGRPVLIGTRSVAASELVEAKLREAGLSAVVLNARQDANEAAIISKAGERNGVTVATNMAGRGTDIHLSAEARSAGGLHVILTEYHESARIDRQLYGRAGRQGDPGSYEIIASLDDELFLRFAPHWTALARLFALPRAPSWLADWARRRAQHRAERLHERIRRESTKSDADLDRALGFAGINE
jgi:preprotein translocase subunit SecA